jgi:hypothetical protein
MNSTDRLAYFEKYIVTLKEKDEVKRVLEEKNKARQEIIARNSSIGSGDPVSNPDVANPVRKSAMAPPTMSSAAGQPATSIFYFYNPTTVAFGKVEFKKNWGERTLNGNWRVGSANANPALVAVSGEEKQPGEKEKESIKMVEQYTADFYLKQLPTAQVELDSINKERNFAYYQLGIIYKEKFKENILAIAKLEQLLKNKPEEKLVLPAMYNLYKLYQLTDANNAVEMKNKISAQFPDSRYAQIINNTNPDAVSQTETPESVYNKWYKLFQEEQFVMVLENSDVLISQFSGDEIVSKFELLKASAIGKLKGLAGYKNALQVVADNYPNSEEGKNALVILTEQIPFLEKMEFKTTDSINWKILYRVGARDDKNTKVLEEKIKLFVENENMQKLYYSYDIYTEKESFIVIHGIKSRVYADDIALILKENAKYKATEPAIEVSGENYKVIQIKKDIETYLAPKK